MCIASAEQAITTSTREFIHEQDLVSQPTQVSTSSVKHTYRMARNYGREYTQENWWF